MRKALSITLMLVVALAVPALAKPVDQTGGLQKFMLEDTTPNANLTSNTGVFGAAQIATTYFGGTVWAADSARWEALPDSIWTFDSGVGSSFSSYPGVNPFKAAGLHTLMEGWIGVDNTFSLLPYFRWISGQAGEPACAITGIGSLYAGVFQTEAEALCYAGGSGYGNSWYVCIYHSTNFTHTAGASVTLNYKYVNDTEPGWDYSYVIVDTSGAGDGSGDVIVTSYTGPASGTASLVLAEGLDMRGDSGPFNVKFCLAADGAYSDEDGLYATTCPLVIDDISILDGATVIHTATFETSNDGWVLAPATPGSGGEWSNIVSQGSLPAVLTPCGCDFMKDGKDTVLVFEDLSVGGHGLYQDNVAMSPWIDLVAAGRVGAPVKFFRYDGYFELPLLNYIFVQQVVQWYPEVCSNTGKIITSGIQGDGYVYYFGGVPTCRKYEIGADSAVYTRYFGSVISTGAEQIRIGLGMLNYCRYYGNCSNVTNHTPYFDNVAFGAAGIPGAPVITAREIDEPQDSFPENGSLRINAAGRLDCNNIKGFSVPEPNSSTGDTLTIGGAAGGAEVYVQFAVDPGPGCTAAVAAWLAGTPGLVFQETKDGLNWYAARMDTAEQGGSTVANRWMTTYMEGFGLVGNDTDRDPADLDPLGQQTRLVNDIFPDNLFTPGTRIEMFFKTKFIAGTAWYTLPDTATTAPFPFEVHPSSMAADSTFNCVLFVDHATDRGSAPWIEPALGAVLTGTSANFEQTAWDKYRVSAPSSQQASFGRPLNTEFGATIIQTLGYKAIVWNSAALSAFCLVKEDADVLIPWLSLTEPGLGYNNLYLNGDGIAESMTLESASEPSALRLLNEFCGVSFNCATLRDPSCPSTSGVQSLATCVPLDPVTGSLVAGSLGVGRTFNHQAQGNGCPQLRSFDVLDLFVGGLGAPAGDEEYNDVNKGVIQYASVYNEVTGGPDYKTVVDGVSLHYRRDDIGVCEFGLLAPTPEYAIAERLEEVLTWFGYTGAPSPCSDPTAGTFVPPDTRQASFKTALANFAPNPLLNGAKGTIQFTMARDAKAAVEIFDVNGRLVRTVFDGVAKEGLNVVHWDGMDSGSRSVASGVYFYRLKANDEEYAKKLVVVRNGN